MSNLIRLQQVTICIFDNYLDVTENFMVLRHLVSLIDMELR